ncbi:hypothetical protein [Salmonella phage PhiSTP2]|nr:hypothetical protein [Salmonella phage PhiSTP2]
MGRRVSTGGGRCRIDEVRKMRTFLFWWLVSFLACCVGGGAVAFWCYGLLPRVLITAAVCALFIMWVRR